MTTLAAFNGMAAENMTRNHGWRFLDMGRRLERAFNLSELLLTLFGETRSEEEETGGLLFALEVGRQHSDVPLALSVFADAGAGARSAPDRRDQPAQRGLSARGDLQASGSPAPGFGRADTNRRAASHPVAVHQGAAGAGSTAGGIGSRWRARRIQGIVYRA